MWYNKIIKEIKENPRKCELCGDTETIHNVMIKYSNGKIMCDDCCIAYYTNQDMEETNND